MMNLVCAALVISATVKSPKSVAFPSVAIVIKSIVFKIFDCQINHLHVNPLVEFEKPAQSAPSLR